MKDHSHPAGRRRAVSAAAALASLAIAGRAPAAGPDDPLGVLRAAETVARDADALLEHARLDRLFETDAAWAVFEPEADVELPTEQPATARFGAAGTQRWTLFGGGGVQPADDRNRFIVAGLGHSWFLDDDISLDVELHGLYVDQSRKDAWAINVNLIFRWHFYSDVSWSLFMDGGAGLFLASDEVPPSGSNFNFTPQIGTGVTFDIGDRNRMVVGVRWHHISNASLYSDNPGRDSVMAYAGVTWPF